MQVKQHQSQTTVDVLQCLYKCYHKRELVLSDFWRFFNVKAFLDIVLKTKVLLLSKLLRVPTLLTVDVPVGEVEHLRFNFNKKNFKTMLK